ncbi:hypothetical protein JAAARDRAFT_63348 [Jaapia argillacea MUCL 33604]|uniref:Uncharacterized protein n=1 Tax=Jaapia argillacea MUCL 33604 TaxID=933084 RepID=A0A067P5E9_9AGAM|nr:hypothetical protein JAAARDRAFT_63348 [Jaapia argillacea MUCL 33604]
MLSQDNSSQRDPNADQNATNPAIRGETIQTVLSISEAALATSLIGDMIPWRDARVDSPAGDQDELENQDEQGYDDYEGDESEDDLLDPQEAVMEYILEVCPEAQYSCATDDDLIPFLKYLNDWASFPAVLRRLAPKVILKPNGLASLAPPPERDHVDLTITAEAELQSLFLGDKTPEISRSIGDDSPEPTSPSSHHDN